MAAVKAGDRVLVHAGAGGVGSLAVQLAKARGAWVAATCSGRNVEFVQEASRGRGARQQRCVRHPWRGRGPRQGGSRWEAPALLPSRPSWPGTSVAPMPASVGRLPSCARALTLSSPCAAGC